MKPSLFVGLSAMARSCRVPASKYAMPLVTVPLPSAHALPLKLMLTSKMFLPEARGLAVPVAAQPTPLLVIVPLELIVTGVDCAAVLPVTPKPEYDPARLARDAA